MQGTVSVSFQIVVLLGQTPPLPTPLVAMGARVWELLEIMDKALYLRSFSFFSRRRNWEAGVPISCVLHCAGRPSSGKDSLSLLSSPQPALGACGRTLRGGGRGGPTQPLGSYQGQAPDLG